jgi:hypothetical protein
MRIDLASPSLIAEDTRKVRGGETLERLGDRG